MQHDAAHFAVVVHEAATAISNGGEVPPPGPRTVMLGDLARRLEAAKATRDFGAMADTATQLLKCLAVCNLTPDGLPHMHAATVVVDSLLRRLAEACSERDAAVAMLQQLGETAQQHEMTSYVMTALATRLLSMAQEEAAERESEAQAAQAFALLGKAL